MRALITGGASRLGRVIAEHLAENNIDLIIHHSSRSRHDAKATREALGTQVEVTLIERDLSDPAQLGSFFAGLAPCDILINNAACFSESNIAELTRPQLLETLEVNALSPLRIAQQFSEQTTSGSIINILDRYIYSAATAHAGYILSKHMLAKITELLAVELAPSIRVNAVAPGMVLPPDIDAKTYSPPATENTLLKRLGSPAHIVSTILFLIQNDFITGEILFVDGGERLQSHIPQR